MHITTILFDFDGVIADSYEANIEYISESLLKFGITPPPKEKFYPLLGQKAFDIIKNFAENKTEEELNKIFSYAYDRSIIYADKVQLTEGVLEFLKTNNKKYNFGIVSSRGRQTLEFILNKFEIKKYFEVIITRDDVARHKPNPEPLDAAVSFLKVNRGNVVYVGDTEIDKNAAKNANIKFILYNRLEKHLEISSQYHILYFSQLDKIISEI